MRRLPRIQFLTLGASPGDHLSQVRLACSGGVRWVQLRAKGLADPEWIALAREVVALCHAHGALCTVNDSPAVALASGADGVHLGREDPDPAEARRLLGPAALIGVTLNALSDLPRLRAGSPDYAGVGPFRPTATKPGHAPVHSARSLRELAREARIPACAIGGVGLADLATLRDLGAAGVAVSSAIALAPDPRAAAAALVAAGEACWA